MKILETSFIMPSFGSDKSSSVLLDCKRERLMLARIWQIQAKVLLDCQSDLYILQMGRKLRNETGDGMKGNSLTLIIFLLNTKRLRSWVRARSVPPVNEITFH